MALTPSLASTEAAAIAGVCSQITSLNAVINQLLSHNTTLAIAWNAGTTPAYITEDSFGNITGLNYSRQSVNAAVASLGAIQATIGGALANLNPLSRPLG